MGSNNGDKDKQTLKIPPDGGWGWIIVVANAISNIVTLSVITNFGLIYNEKLTKIAMSATNVSLIVNINSAFSMSTGLVIGPLLKHFGYRKMALTAGFLFTIGLMLTSPANTFLHFIITYSIITAAGYGFTTASFSQALNTYFKKKRNKAAGITMTITGLGPIVYPQLITFLLGLYGAENCVLILSGVSAHLIMAALLLQPVKQHLIYPVAICTDNESKLLNSPNSETQINKTEDNNKTGTYNIESTGQYSQIEHIYDENSATATQPIKENDLLCAMNGSHNPNNTNGVNKNSRKKFTFGTSIKRWIITSLDLDLLRDRIFANIILGMAVATFAEINFSVLTPFILSELHFSTLEIATMMSTLAVADIVTRFVSPFVGDYFNLTSRTMYIISLVGLIATRSCILIITNFEKLLIVGIGLGVFKGIRTVYMNVVIPNHVSLDKLASANGLRMVSNAIMLILLAPVVGLIKDLYGSYLRCIIFINIVSFICVVMWTAEILYVQNKQRKICAVDM